MTHSYVWHDSFIRVTRLIHTCDLTHSYVWHDSFIRVTRLIHTCNTTHSNMQHDLLIHATWLAHLFTRMSHDTCHDSFIHVTWRIHIRHIPHLKSHRTVHPDTTHPYICTNESWQITCDSFIHVTWLTHMFAWASLDFFVHATRLIHNRDMTHQGTHNTVQPGMTHSYICTNASWHTTRLIHACDTTHSRTWHDSLQEPQRGASRLGPLTHMRKRVMTQNESHECVPYGSFTLFFLKKKNAQKSHDTKRIAWMRAIRLIYKYGMTHHKSHDAVQPGMTHSYICTNESWHTTTHHCVRHDSFTHVTWLTTSATTRCSQAWCKFWTLTSCKHTRPLNGS